jgi:ATP-dependent Lon protease
MIVDYLAEYLREMRKRSFSDAIDKWFRLGNNLNQRDTIAVRRTVSGLLKLVCPHGEYDKEAVRQCLEYALETRRRVKEQLKKIGGMEFYDVHFSYIDLEDGQERFVNVPEQTGGGLIPEGRPNPGIVHTIAMSGNEMPTIYRIEIQTLAGTGKLLVSGPLSREPVRIAFDYFKAHASRVSGSIRAGEHDFHLHLVDLQGGGEPDVSTLASLIALCSGALGRPVQSQLAIMGDMSLGGVITPTRNLAESLQVAFDAGAKRILLPMSSVGDIPTVPGELFAKFQTSFYSDPVDAVFKAVGVE